MSEVWKPIEGYPYSVSDRGRVRRNTGGQGAVAGRILRPGLTDKGYRMVVLSVNGNRWTVPVHILVARAFLGPCPPGHEVNHKNTVKTDNSVGNLEYLTKLENIRHGFAHNCRDHAKGKRHWNSRLMEKDVLRIRKLAAQGVPPAKIARMYADRVKPAAIDKIIYGRTWKHLLPENNPLPVAA